jgi:SAM-dependent methyltransferase
MHATQWSDDDAYWTATYPFMFPESRFVQAATGLPKLLALVGCSEGTVLDLCCGPGRHAVPLARIGFKVTAVDRTSFLLDKAKAYAAAANAAPNIEWVQADMRDFLRPNAFNLALSMFTSFGYFEDLDDNRKVLRNVFASLTSGGVLLMDVMGKETLAKNFRPTHSDMLPNGDLLVERTQVVEDWSKVQGEWTIIKAGHVQTFQIRLWCFSARELKDLLHSAGFSRVSVFGDADGKPYGPDARRLMAVAWK